MKTEKVTNKNDWAWFLLGWFIGVATGIFSALVNWHKLTDHF